jgi:hypothetical protein
MILYLKTHNVTGMKYLGQTTRNPYKYEGSGVYWRRHIEMHGNNVTTEILYQSDNQDNFEKVCIDYSAKFDVVNNKMFANLIEEHGNSLGGKANPNYKTGKYTGRLDNPELYKQLDRDHHSAQWDNKKEYAHPRMNFYHHKRIGNKERAEYYWNIWYSMAPKKSNNRQALWKTDTFEMWYNRKGNDLDFREKYN